MLLEEQIKSEQERRSAEREAKIEAAKLLGNLQECLCCYSADCLPDDMIPCKAGHLYCRDCISRGTSVAIGDGKTVIECLGHCQEEIGWQELQKVVAPNVLSKLLQRRQAEEVGAADLDNLVTCPFCPYVTIMDNENDKVLICRNPDCGRESCRLCKEPNHVPLRCDEIEKADEETERKRIEEQLSEAMMRECYKCKVKYFKEEGCNKMACPRPGCGAMMCYLCKQPVRDYTHFYGQGGEPTNTRTCPLWTDNKKLHEQEVANAAAKAKEELQKKNIQLKHDPTAGVALPAGGKVKDKVVKRPNARGGRGQRGAGNPGPRPQAPVPQPRHHAPVPPPPGARAVPHHPPRIQDVPYPPGPWWPYHPHNPQLQPQPNNPPQPQFLNPDPGALARFMFPNRNPNNNNQNPNPK